MLYTLFGKENLQMYCSYIVTFTQQLVKASAICSEQLCIITATLYHKM